jgi:hypothetical protein
MDGRIEQLYEYIRKTDPDVIKENVYVCIANSCILLTANIKSNGKKGWSSRLVDEHDQPILNSKERETLEKILEKAPWVRNFFKGDDSVQTGGMASAPHNSADKESADMLDALFQKIDEMDTYWNEMKTFDTVKQMLDTEQLVPTPFGVPVPIKPRVVVTFLMMLLDFIRLSLAKAGYTNTTLTLIVLIEEMVTGQWRQMIMTAAGFISPSGVVAGVIGKYIIIAWLAIDSRLRSSIIRNIFKGTKSMIRNMLIWFYASLTPDAIKEAMFSIKMPSLPKIPKMPKIPEMPKIPTIPQMPKIPEIPQVPKIPMQSGGANSNKITYEYIQDKLKILDSPKLLCDKDFEEIVAKIQDDPILGAVLAMFNIPTYEKLKSVCVKAEGTNSFAEVEDMEDGLNIQAITPSASSPPASADAPPASAPAEASAPEASAPEASAPEASAPPAPPSPPASASAPPSASDASPADASASATSPPDASAPSVEAPQKGGSRRNRKYKRKTRKNRR